MNLAGEFRKICIHLSWNSLDSFKGFGALYASPFALVASTFSCALSSWPFCRLLDSMMPLITLQSKFIRTQAKACKLSVAQSVAVGGIEPTFEAKETLAPKVVGN